jgi:hypothetical protein
MHRLFGLLAPENSAHMGYVSCPHLFPRENLMTSRLVIDRGRITDDCVRGFGFLAELTDQERIVANDRYQREETAAANLREEL